MHIEFVRFEAGDGLGLQGWLSEQPGEVAALHIHGKSGNGYENRFLDNLREMYTTAGISFFAIDTRGRGVVSWFTRGSDTVLGGSCYELFDESAHDIQGAIAFLKSRGKTKFILQGHSLGCAKVVNYLLTQGQAGVAAVVLLAPTDMTGWAGRGPGSEQLMARAKQMVTEGKGHELLDAECGLDKTAMTAAAYVTMHDAGSAVDIYGERPGGPLLGRVEPPTLIAYGDQDVGITQIDGSMDAWLERVHKFKTADTEIMVIKGAPHSFAAHEPELAARIQEFLGQLADRF